MSEWTLLVTQGHVRAARWRNAVPLVFMAAVAVVVIGIAIPLVVPTPAPSSAVAEAKSQYATQQRAAVSTFLQGKGEVGVVPNPERAFSREAATASVDALLLTLNQTGSLPQTVISQSPQEFWAGDWQPGTVYAVEKGRNILIGYLVDNAIHMRGFRTPSALQRAFGLFRRGENNVWTFWCLSIPGAQQCQRQSLEPASIPATMRSVLPSAAFATEARS